MKSFRKSLLVSASALTLLLASGVSANQLDNLNNQQSTTQQSGSSSQEGSSVTDFVQQGTNQQGADNFNSPTGTIADTMKGISSVDQEDMARARANSGWLQDLIGYVISFLLIGTLLGVTLITAIDVAYLGLPIIRPYLYTAGTDGAGGINGMSQSTTTSFMGKQWVSDEAVMVASTLGGNAQSQGHGGGMGMGYGGGAPGVMMGGSSYGGGLGAQNNSTLQKGGKSPIRVYLQKRIVFLVYLGICTVLLFTSAFTDFGINIGGMLLDFLAFLGSKLGLVSFQ